MAARGVRVTEVPGAYSSPRPGSPMAQSAAVEVARCRLFLKPELTRFPRRNGPEVRSAPAGLDQDIPEMKCSRRTEGSFGVTLG